MVLAVGITEERDGGGAELTARQRTVLDAVLTLMVEQGGELTMTDIARRASCSKETLYKWFGDRDGVAERHRPMAGLQGSGGQLRCAEAGRCGVARKPDQSSLPIG